MKKIVTLLVGFFVFILVSSSEAGAWLDYIKTKCQEIGDACTEINKTTKEYTDNLNKTTVGGEPYEFLKFKSEGGPETETNVKGGSPDSWDRYSKGSDWEFNAAYRSAQLFCDRYREGTAKELCYKQLEVIRLQRGGTDQSYIDYTTGKEIQDLWIKMRKECDELEKKYDADMEKATDAIEHCDFSSANLLRDKIIRGLSYRCPESTTNRKACQDLPTIVNHQKDLLKKAQEEANKALEEGLDSQGICESWDLPSLVYRDVLDKCEPSLLKKLKDVSLSSKKRAKDYETYEKRRDAVFSQAERSLQDCSNLQDTFSKLRQIDKDPVNQECMPDEQPQKMMRKVEDRIRGLDDRKRRISQLLQLANEGLFRCDWRGVDRLVSQAMNLLPEDTCLQNYPGFLDLNERVTGAESRKGVREKEFQPLYQKLLEALRLCQGAFKTPGRAPNEVMKTWDENAVRLYNEYKDDLDSHVREAYTQGFADCMRDIISQANSLPQRLSVPVVRRDSPEKMVEGVWEFGRLKAPQSIGAGKIGTITLTLNKGRWGYMIGAPHHPNESFWELDKGALVFKHSDSSPTTRFTRPDPNNWNYWVGEYIPHKDTYVKGVVHYLKR